MKGILFINGNLNCIYLQINLKKDSIFSLFDFIFEKVIILFKSGIMSVS